MKKTVFPAEVVRNVRCEHDPFYAPIGEYKDIAVRQIPVSFWMFDIGDGFILKVEHNREEGMWEGWLSLKLYGTAFYISGLPDTNCKTLEKAVSLFLIQIEIDQRECVRNLFAEEYDTTEEFAEHYPNLVKYLDY